MEKAVLTKWAIDPTHSEVQFKVKHLVISSVTGKFSDFSGSLIQEEENFQDAEVEFSAKIDSIETGVPDRDAHLKSDDFFNAAQYPELKFIGKSFTKIDKHHYKLAGNLTIRNITKTIELDVLFGGTVADPYGQIKAGFEISGSISRKEFDLKWNAITEAGSIVVSDFVKLELNIQLIQQ